MLDRREFINSTAAGLLGLVVAGNGSKLSASPLLEDLAQSEKKPIGKFSDGFNDLKVLEAYSDGYVLSQSAKVIEPYTADIIYFVRNGSAGKLSEWSVKCNLYKQNALDAKQAGNTLVDSLIVDGSINNGKMKITNRSKLKETDSEAEVRLLQGLYDQSSLSVLESYNEANLKNYINFFEYYVPPTDKESLARMPARYDPLK